MQISTKSWTTGGTDSIKKELLLNSKAKSFRIWENDTKCDSFMTQFAMPGSLPTRALVSYPGSGMENVHSTSDLKNVITTTGYVTHIASGSYMSHILM